MFARSNVLKYLWGLSQMFISVGQIHRRANKGHLQVIMKPAENTTNIFLKINEIKSFTQPKPLLITSAVT